MPQTAGAIRAARAYVEFFADNNALTKGLKLAQAKLRGFATFASGLGRSIFIGFGAAAAAPFGLAVKSASDLEEQMNKFNVVFGENASAVKAWGDAFAKGVGRSKRQVVETVAGFQDLLIPIGLDPAAAEAASKQLTALSVDLASFNNKADADVVRDLQAALTGSSETMKKYGVVVGMTAVNQELLNQGIKPTEATEAQKAMARLTIIMAGTTAAQGDAIRSSGSFANQMKRLKAGVEDASAEIGKALLPALSEIVGKVSGFVETVGKWASQNQGLVKTIVLVTAAMMGAGVALVVTGTLASSLASILGLVTGAFSLVGSAIGVVIGLLGALATPIGIVIALMGALTAFFIDWGTVVGKTTEFASREFEGFKERALSAWGGIRDAIAAGDLALAFKIVVLALRAEWIRLTNSLKAKWAEFSGFFERMITTAGFNIVGNLTNIWGGLQHFWNDMIAAMLSAFFDFGAWIGKKFLSVIGFIRKAWETLKSSITGTKGKSFAQIDKETAAWQANADKQNRDRQKGLSKSRTAESNRIDRERETALRNLAAGQRQVEIDRKAKAGREQEAADKKLAAAKKELDNAIGEAKTKREAADAERAKLDVGQRPDVNKALAGFNGALGAKTSVQSTSGVFDRFSAFGQATDPAAKDRKKMIEELELIKSSVGKTARDGSKAPPLL